ncbi:MAG: hypothetical protein GX933_02535 [Chloroflexi bacterium]|nr:hypothetical protein [Chloroflexota bacterium]
MSEEPIVMTCYRHPNRETLLRCNQCEKPICLDCAVSTPTGYRCKQCISKQQKRFNHSMTSDYLVAAAITAPLAALGTFLLYHVQIFPFVLSTLLGIGMGTLIVRLVRAATHRRRSQRLNQVTGAAAILGGLAPIAQYMISFLRAIFAAQYGMLWSNTLSVLWGVLYVTVLYGTILSNMKGFSIQRY